MTEAVIAIGSNVGDTLGNLREAVRQLEAEGCRVIKKSRLYLTEPWGYKDQDDFLNGAVLINTGLEPHALLMVTQSIEKAMGREKLFLNGPRNIDLDILLYGEESVNLPDLLIPHPRITERLFVLKPLCDVASHMQIPGFGTAEDALKAYDGSERVELTDLIL